MKLIRLELKGFGSYRDHQIVDFTGVSLFAISGKTGSGKSTLLDALLFALFRETPRAGKKGHADLIFPTADEARVELSFEAQQTRWRITRSAVRKGNSLTLLEYEVDGAFRRHPSSQAVGTVNETIESVLGMDYQTFCRAVLLPQGEFDAFLFGDSGDKKRTLMRLYQLEELPRMKEVLKRKNQARSQNIAVLRTEMNTLRSTLQGIDPETLRARIEQAEQELGAARGQQSVLRDDLDNARRDFELWQQLHRANRSWQIMQTQTERQQLRLGTLQRHHQALKLWTQVEKLQQAEQQLSELRAEQATHQHKVDQLEERQESLRLAFSEEQLTEAREAVSRLPVVGVQLDQLRTFGGRVEMVHPQPLPFDVERLHQLKQLEDQLAERGKRQKLLEDARGRHRSRIQQVSAVETRLAELDRALQVLEQQQQDTNTQLEQARTALQAATLREGLAGHRHNLQPGQSCPLCLQLVGVVPPDPVSDLGELRAVSEGLELRARQLNLEVPTLQGERGSLQRQLPDLKAESEQTFQQVQEWEQQLDQLPPVSASPEQLAEERQQRLAQLALEITAITGGIDWGVYQREVNARLSRLEAHKQESDQLQSLLMEARNRLVVSRTKADVQSDNLDELRRDFQQALQQENFSSIEEVRAAHLAPGELRALEDEENRFQQERQQLEAQRNQLHNRLLGQSEVTEEQVRQLETAEKQLNAQLSQVEVNLGIWRNDLGKAVETRGRIQKLDGELARAESEVAEWYQLADDLQANRFEGYLFDLYQQQLLAQASHTMHQLSQGQYRLGLIDGDYKVLDSQHAEPRNASTLSGGERFMASLALALALSDNLSRGQKGNLFLDEGFGSLSGDLLEEVARMLEALPESGRTVGIITHVSELAERLPDRLMVTKNEAGVSHARWTGLD